MADLARLTIEIDSNGVVRATGDLNKLVQKGKDAETATGKLESGWSKLSRTVVTLNQGFQLATSVVNTIVGSFRDLTDAYREQESAELKLQAALKATHSAVGISQEAMQDYALELSRMTGISDESLIATEALMTTFTQVGRETFPRAIEAAADMSKMFGQDLQQSAIQLGTALNDPIAGVGRLRRIGISFTESQKDMIKKFMETNDIASAQKVILDELNAEFGGVARTIGGSAIGALDKLKNSTVDLKEQLGKTVVNGLQPFTEAITVVVNKFTDWLAKQNEITEALDAIENGTANSEQKLISYKRQLVEQVETLASLKQAQGYNVAGMSDAIKAQEELIASTQQMIGVITHSIAMEKQASKLKEEQAAADAKAAANKKKAADELAEWLKIVNEAYAKTAEARRESINAEIAQFEQMLTEADKTRPKIEAILKMLYSMRDSMNETSENSTLKNLRQQVDLLGKSENEILKYKLAMEGATEAEIKEALALNDKLTAANEAEEMRRRGEELTKQYRTEEELLANKEAEINALYAAGAIDLETKNRALKDLKKTTDDYTSVLSDLGNQITELALSSSLDVFNDIGASLAGSKDGVDSFADAMANLGNAILQQLPLMLLNAGLQLIAQGQWVLGLSFIASSGILAIGAGAADYAMNENASGNAFDSGNIIPFASGGTFTNSIVSAPTIFPMASGGIGLMGEAGPEAVIPLTRTSDGKLGVSAEGTGANVEINIINNTSEKAEVKKTNNNGKQIYSIIIGTVKQGMATGEFDGDFRNNYGINRRGVAG